MWWLRGWSPPTVRACRASTRGALLGGAGGPLATGLQPLLLLQQVLLQALLLLRAVMLLLLLLWLLWRLLLLQPPRSGPRAIVRFSCWFAAARPTGGGHGHRKRGAACQAAPTHTTVSRSGWGGGQGARAHQARGF